MIYSVSHPKICAVVLGRKTTGSLSRPWPTLKNSAGTSGDRRRLQEVEGSPYISFTVTKIPHQIRIKIVIFLIGLNLNPEPVVWTTVSVVTGHHRVRHTQTIQLNSPYWKWRQISNITIIVIEKGQIFFSSKPVSSFNLNANSIVLRLASAWLDRKMRVAQNPLNRTVTPLKILHFTQLRSWVSRVFNCKLYVPVFTRRISDFFPLK